jgi:hypothetical protein
MKQSPPGKATPRAQLSVFLLDQLHALQTPDDDAIIHGNAERAGDIDDRPNRPACGILAPE